jgi:hypothetical protein
LPFLTFQIEHIIARKHGGSDDPSNLALARDRCYESEFTPLCTVGLRGKSGEILPQLVQTGQELRARS